MLKKTSLALFALLLLGGFTTELSGKSPLGEEPRKKLIQFGWDNPEAAYLDKNLDIIETFLPYDGVGIRVNKTITLSNGKRVDNTWFNFSKNKYKFEWYKKDIEHLKNIHRRAKKLKYNFIGASASSFTGEFDLFDDEFWDAVCNNFSIFARVAKEGGCKGIRFDLEDYGNQQLWRFRAEKGKSYRESWEKARERGRQWMNAIAKEYPDITIFCFFWLDLMMGYADGSPKLYERLEGCGTGLLVAFINGIYDVLPPKAKLVDGMESHGYAAKNLNDYQTMRALRSIRFPKLLAPENRRKFYEQSSLSVATYITCYHNNSKKNYSFREQMEAAGMTPLEFFRKNFTDAVAHSDEYAWTWNEQRKWIPIPYQHAWQNNTLKHFPDVPGPYIGMAIPGIEKAMEYARDPWQYAMNLLKDTSKLKNLLKNASFEGNGGKHAVNLAPDSKVFKELPNWETWRKKQSKATFALARGKGYNNTNAIVIMDGEGVAHQGVKIDPNGAYIIRAKMKVEGKGGGSLSIQWRNKKGRWHNHSMNIAAPFNEDLGNGWKRATVIVRTIPANTYYLNPLLSSTAKKGSKVYFDDVEVFSMFEKNPQAAPHLKDALDKWLKKRAAETSAEALKNAKKSPLAKGNRIPNGNFTSFGEYQEGEIIKGATLFKSKFQTFTGKKKAKFYTAVGKNIGYSDDTAGVIAGGDGIILFNVRQVKSGEKYRVAVKVKNLGKGKEFLKIYYRSKRAKGPFDYALGIPVIPRTKTLENGYVQLEGFITIPEPANGFTLILEGKGQNSDKDVILFDEAEAILLK